jgi:hypothetical protein
MLYSLVTRRPQSTPFDMAEHTNQGRSPPNRHGVQAMMTRCSTSLQSSPSGHPEGGAGPAAASARVIS